MENQLNVSVNLYEHVKNFLQTKNPLFISAGLKKTETFTEENFQVLGAISYLFGQDFITQPKGKLTKKVVENVIARFQDVGISSDKILSAISTIYAFGNSKFPGIRDTQDKYINKFNDLLPATKENGIMRVGMKGILLNSQIPVIFSKDVNDLISQPGLSYHQILQFNSIFNENCIVRGGALKSYIELLDEKKSTFRKMLEKASNLFERQKYGVIYLDSIISLYEYLYENPLPEDWKLIFDEEKSAEYIANIHVPTKEEFEAEQNSQAEEKATKPTKKTTIRKNQTDLVIKELFLEVVNNSGVEKEIQEDLTVVQIVSVINSIFESDEHLKDLYSYMTNNMTIGRRKFASVWTKADQKELLAALQAQLDDSNEKYKKIVEEYTQEIPNTELNILVKKFNDLISVLEISDSKSKGYLTTQLMENQIKTVNHLHQMINVMENQFIQVSDLDKYLDFADYIKHLKNPNVIDIFSIAPSLDKHSSYVQFLKKNIEFFSN